MKKIKETEKGFYGCYFPLEGATCAIIAMLGDDCEDYMARSSVKWLQKKFGISVLTLSPAHKDYSHHNLPVERIGAAISYLQKRGMKKIGIAGASTTGMFALIAASYYPQITLTIAMTPCDFVMEGFYQGKRDGQTEWPGEGESTASWEGKPLPYLPYAYRHPEYGMKMKDDALWEAGKYIRRMEKRLAQREHECSVESYIYEHATHFVFPEGMVKSMLPVGGDLITRFFAAGRKYPKECKEARIDIDKRVTRAINDWKKQ